MKKLILLFVVLCSLADVNSQSIVKYYLISASAAVNATTPSVKVDWLANTTANSCQIQRKTKEAATWESMIPLDKAASSYTDNNVLVGKTYEYHIVRNLPYISNKDAVQYITVGIDLPVVDYRGKVILLVESSVSAYLKDPIDRLILDMICDGWQVLRYDVPMAETAVNVKNIIKTAYTADPANVKAVFILGHVAVPYSGNLAPDGHADHYGAWVADGYYGDMNGTWTDVTVNNTGASDPANDNIPGDGKFDQSSFPSDIELQVGRVDLYNLPRFKDYDALMDESELLWRYLDKDHAFRSREFGAQRRGLIDDQFYISYGENMAAGSWGSYYTLVGSGNISDSYQDNHIFVANRNTHYLFAHGDGPGSTASAGNVIKTDDFASKLMTFNYVFTCIFGSGLGDWDKQNNVMRASLASKGSILTCAWSGRPYWWFHHLGNGENIGYCARANQNNNGLYFANGYSRNVHITLLGDPTLRMHILAPPMNLKDTVISTHVNLRWSPSPDSVLGYHVYKADSLNSVYTRLTTSPVTDTFYIDNAVAAGNYVYIVKAVKKEVNSSGSYFNTSRGIIASNIASVTDVPIVLHPPKLINKVADAAIPESAAWSLKLDNVFADAGLGDVLTLSMYQSNKNPLPTGWTFNASTSTLSVASPKKGTYTYVVKATDTQLFEVTDTFTITVGSVSVNEISAVNIQAYPNPFIDRIKFEISGKQTGNLSLFNTEGKLVLSEEIISEGTVIVEVDMTNLAAGVYYYQYRTKDNLINGMVIKL